MLRLVRNAPLLVVALTAIFSLVQVACADAEDPTVSEGALYGGEDAGYVAPACRPMAPTVVWMPPQQLHQNVCTAAQIDGIASALIEHRHLEEPSPDNAACYKCAFTLHDDRSSGAALFWNDGSYELNRGGCIAQLTGDLSARGCGAAVQKATRCPHDACRHCGWEHQATCRPNASSVCVDMQQAAGCADELTRPGGAAEACAAGSDAETVRRYLSLFCGP